MTRQYPRVLLVCLLALTTLTACNKTKTTVPASWQNPAYQSAEFKKLFVIGLDDDDEGRRLFEDSFARSLASEEVDAEASWKSLPIVDELTDEQIREAIAGGGFDGVLITRLVGVDVKAPKDATRYYSDYRDSYAETHDPAYFDPNADYRLETRLYSVRTEELVWVGQSVTVTPASVADAIDSMTVEVAKTLKEKGLVAWGLGLGRTPGSGDQESY